MACWCRWRVRSWPARISWSGWTGAARTPPGSSWSRCPRRRRRPPRSWRSVSPQHMWPGSRTGSGCVIARVLSLVSPARRRTGCWRSATIDGDTTDVEVYGRKKQDAVYNYQGQRAYRPHIAFWAEGGVTLAADLMKADEDPRPVAAQLLDRADRGAATRGGEGAVSLGRRVFRRGPGQALHHQGGRVRDRGQTQHRRGPRLPDRAGRRLAPGQRHGPHRGRRHRLPAREVAEQCRCRVYRPADPDPGRADADRPAGPEAADDRQGRKWRWPWRGRSITCTGTRSS